MPTLTPLHLSFSLFLHLLMRGVCFGMVSFPSHHEGLLPATGTVSFPSARMKVYYLPEAIRSKVSYPSTMKVYYLRDANQAVNFPSHHEGLLPPDEAVSFPSQEGLLLA